MTLRLSHLNLPARDPERLAQWYAEELGFERRGTFLIAPDTLLVFEAGEPLGTDGNTHFGFQLDSADEARRWAAHFGMSVEAGSEYVGIKVRDPEGNCFELYWEPPGAHLDPAP